MKLSALAVVAAHALRLDVSVETADWVLTMFQGWTDLTGFMREKEYLRSLHYQDPPVPIVLPCPAEAKEAKVLELYYEGTFLGKLKDIEVYEHLKEERAARTFGTSHPDMPYTKNFILEQPDFLCGGDIEYAPMWSKGVTHYAADGLDKYRLAPKDIDFGNADAVFVFQLRNPIHNGHALLMQDTYAQLKKEGYKNPTLWINPLGGWTKDDDVPLDTRMAQHEALIKNKVFGKDTKVILSIFPSPMLYAGPREVQWHALSRQKAGASHYIVGRDPAGMKHPGTKTDLYSAWHGATMLKMNPKFNMKIVDFKFASYDTKAKKMAFFEPARKDDFVSISGTKMRKMAKENETPPVGFMDPDGWKILLAYYQGKKQEL